MRLGPLGSQERCVWPCLPPYTPTDFQAGGTGYTPLAQDAEAVVATEAVPIPWLKGTGGLQIT